MTCDPAARSGPWAALSPCFGGSGRGGTGQDHLELRSGVDAKFREDLAQVVLHRAGTDEELSGCLRVRQSVSREPDDLGLLPSEVARVPTARRSTVSPVADSSREARSANACVPIAVNMSWAARSSVRAADLRPSRRSHSPYWRCERARPLSVCGTDDPGMRSSRPPLLPACRPAHVPGPRRPGPSRTESLPARPATRVRPPGARGSPLGRRPRRAPE